MARGRSVPARTPPKESLSGPDNGYNYSKSLAKVIIPSPSVSPMPSNSALITARPNSNLVQTADAAARMMIEINVQAMAAQTARLQKDLDDLMKLTTEDKEFRNTHNARVQTLVKEIQAVKQRMEEIQGPEWKIKSNNDREQCKKDMHEIIAELKKEMKKEMSDLKGRVGDLSSTLDRLPTVAEAEALISHTRVTRSALKGKVQAKPDIEKSRSVSTKTIKQRIEETIDSTRRWNRDHKSTKLKDAAFIVSYLKQQSKRDPQMALYIQKNIQRRVYHSGRPRSKTRPKTLEQFCQMLVWKDVLDTVKDVLVDNRSQALLGK
ncbi:hypothetical protein HDV64DRAFT_276807 [Trichoderma sp. TUCIM 5745]